MRYFLTRILPLVFMLTLNACSTMPRFGASDNGAEALPTAVTSRYERALDEMRSGEDTRAIELFEGFVAAYPEYPGASLNLAKLQLRNDRADAAVHVLKNCILLNPDYAPAYNQLGIIFRERGEFDRANTIYLNAIEVDRWIRDLERRTGTARKAEAGQ
jgi:Flp pilus assembly protein TadD